MTTTTTDRDTMALTADDVARLHAAASNRSHRVTFSIVADWRRDRAHAITVIEDREAPEGFDGSISRRDVIPTMGDFERYRNDGDVDRMVCSSTIYQSRRFDGVRCIAANVRVGDMLHLHWVLGNDTTIMKDAGITHDECHLAHIRKGKVIAVATVDNRITTSDTFVDRHYRIGDGK